MIFSHRHDFRFVARTYAPPCGAAVSSNDVKLISMVAMGTTSYLWMCSCGERRMETLLGREDRGVVEVKFSEVKR
jgi:hypothetical protein